MAGNKDKLKQFRFAEEKNQYIPRSASPLKKLDRKQMVALIAAATGRDSSNELYAYETRENLEATQKANTKQIEKDLPRSRYVLPSNLEDSKNLGNRFINNFNRVYQIDGVDFCRNYLQGDLAAFHSFLKNNLFKPHDDFKSNDEFILNFRFANANYEFAVIVQTANSNETYPGFAKVMLKEQSVFAFNHNGETSYFLPKDELSRLISIAEKRQDQPSRDNFSALKDELEAIPDADLRLYLDEAITDDKLKKIFKNSILQSGQVSLVPLRFIPVKSLPIGQEPQSWNNTFFSIDEAYEFSNYFAGLNLSGSKERFFNAFSYFLCGNAKIRNKLDANVAKSLFDDLGKLYESLRKKKNGAELLKNIELAFYEDDPRHALIHLKEYRKEFFIFFDILKGSLPIDQLDIFFFSDVLKKEELKNDLNNLTGILSLPEKNRYRDLVDFAEKHKHRNLLIDPVMKLLDQKIREIPNLIEGEVSIDEKIKRNKSQVSFLKLKATLAGQIKDDVSFIVNDLSSLVDLLDHKDIKYKYEKNKYADHIMSLYEVIQNFKDFLSSKQQLIDLEAKLRDKYNSFLQENPNDGLEFLLKNQHDPDFLVLMFPNLLAYQESIKTINPDLALFLPILEDIYKNTDKHVLYNFRGLFRIIMSNESGKLDKLTDIIYDTFINPLVVAEKCTGYSEKDNFSQKALTSLLQVLDSRIEIDLKQNNLSSLKIKANFVRKLKEQIKNFPNLNYLCDLELQGREILKKQKSIISDLLIQLEGSPYLYPKWHDPRQGLRENTKLHFIKLILEVIFLSPSGGDLFGDIKEGKNRFLQQVETVFQAYNFNKGLTEEDINSFKSMLDKLQKGEAVNISLPIFECLNDPDKQEKPKKLEKIPSSFFMNFITLFLEKIKEALNRSRASEKTLVKPSGGASAKNRFGLFACFNSKPDSDPELDSGFEFGPPNDLNTQ